MHFLIACLFGAGIAGVTYTRMGRRLGYANTQNVNLIVGIAFVLSTIVFYTILVTVANR